MRHAPSMSTRRRLIAVLAVVGVLADRGCRVGVLHVFGIGDAAHASTGTMSTVTLSATAGSPSTPLYPGGTGDVSLEVNNPNAYAVTLVSVTGNGTITADAGHSGCTTTGVTFTQPDRAQHDHPGQCQQRPDPPVRGGVDGPLVVERLPGGDVLHPRHDHGAQVMSQLTPAHAAPSGEKVSFSPARGRACDGGHSRRSGRRRFRLLADDRQLQPGGCVGHEPRRRRVPAHRGLGDRGKRQLDEPDRSPPAPSTWSRGQVPARRPCAPRRARASSATPSVSTLPRQRPLPGYRLQLLGHRRARYNWQSSAGTASFTTMAVNITTPSQRLDLRRQLGRFDQRDLLAGHREPRSRTSRCRSNRGADRAGRARGTLDDGLPELRGDGRHGQQLDAEPAHR